MDCKDRQIAASRTRLFVYGTLRKGFRSHPIMQRLHARFLGRGRVHGRLFDLGRYPGAVGSEDRAEFVSGEVYRLPRAEMAFRVLDRYEGFDPSEPESNEFVRKETIVTMDSGREIRAWIYWLLRTRASGRRIQSGNYPAHRAECWRI
jgi:gamma-glutamylcyclotransferase (GGCT)/AIG2-like uncharacterized protein YtfP